MTEVTLSMNTLNALMKKEQAVAACGCGGVCRECRATLEAIELLSEAEKEQLAAYCANV